jgi:hypothetical protein
MAAVTRINGSATLHCRSGRGGVETEHCHVDIDVGCLGCAFIRPATSLFRAIVPVLIACESVMLLALK